jgi:hypothetical protein
VVITAAPPTDCAATVGATGTTVAARGIIADATVMSGSCWQDSRLRIDFPYKKENNSLIVISLMSSRCLYTRSCSLSLVYPRIASAAYLMESTVIPAEK